MTQGKEVAQAIAAMLQQAGTTANVKTVDTATFDAEFQQGKYGVYLQGRGNILDPSAYMVQYFRSGASKRSGT